MHIEKIINYIPSIMLNVSLIMAIITVYIFCFGKGRETKPYIVSMVILITVSRFLKYYSVAINILIVIFILALVIISIKWLAKKIVSQIAPQPQCSCGGLLRKKNGCSSTYICNNNRSHPEVIIL